jgi:hypothetical protein
MWILASKHRMHSLMDWLLQSSCQITPVRLFSNQADFMKKYDWETAGVRGENA